MKLGIMQPYFFPYLGYFDLINRTDKWVVLDVVQYNDRTWMNRNRILHPTKGWQYISVPVKHQTPAPRIMDALLADKDAAHKRILGQIDHYRASRAPYFDEVRDLLNACFATSDPNHLCDLNVRSLAVVCERLEIPFDPILCSKALPDLTEVAHAGAWALEIAAQLGASDYLNPPGGVELFVPAEFEARGIKLAFTDMVDFSYACPRYEFVSHLSMIDVLMWNSPAAVKQYLDSRKA